MTVRILNDDALAVLRTLPDASVQMCVTSPPYWGLREYGTATWEGGDPACDHAAPPNGGRNSSGLNCGGEAQHRYIAKLERSNQYPKVCKKCSAIRVDQQIGLEATSDEYVAKLVEVFREVRRVLRDDGTLWLNLGDCYANDGKWGGATGGKHAQYLHGGETRIGREKPGLKPKDLIGIPWMVAFALRADGWFLRSDIIWAKKNCMPESIRDRPTTAHEHIFLFAKSGDKLYWTHRRDKQGTRSRPPPDYRWFHKLSKEEVCSAPPDPENWLRINLWDGHDYFYDAVAIEEEGDIPAGTRAAKGSNVRSEIKGVNGRPAEYYEYTGKRNKRSVWWMATQPYPAAHFATFPEKLPETCIKAGTSERGCCRTCGAPWARIVGRQRIRDGEALTGSFNTGDGYKIGASGVGHWRDETKTTTFGWQPTCDCPPHEPVPCTVLDCFFGAGTTGMVADRLGRDCIGIELSVQYQEMARNRVIKDGPLFAEVTA